MENEITLAYVQEMVRRKEGRLGEKQQILRLMDAVGRLAHAIDREEGMEEAFRRYSLQHPCAGQYLRHRYGRLHSRLCTHACAGKKAAAQSRFPTALIPCKTTNK